MWFYPEAIELFYASNLTRLGIKASWFSIIFKGQLIPEVQVGPLKAEALPLVRIVGASIQTVTRNQGAYPRNGKG